MKRSRMFVVFGALLMAFGTGKYANAQQACAAQLNAANKACIQQQKACGTSDDCLDAEQECMDAAIAQYSQCIGDGELKIPKIRPDAIPPVTLALGTTTDFGGSFNPLDLNYAKLQAMRPRKLEIVCN